GSLRIPLDELRDRLGELPAGRIVVHCKVGQRGHTAVRLLAQHGRDAVNLDGGYLTWKAGTDARELVADAPALAA
ncbi:MAG TPA: rhodanese-like domain-containing protein, partial [Agromyces sp.]